MNNVYSLLAQVEPFARLPANEIARVAGLARVVTFTKGECVYNEGEQASHVWVLQQGRLQTFKYSSDGRAVAVESIEPKDFFGILDRFGSRAPTYMSSVVACVEAVVIQIPETVFNDLCRRFPVVTASVCNLCSRRLAALQEAISMSQEPVQTRVLRTLFRLQQTNGNVLAYTKREISELSATTVETTIRVLSGFEKKHWIASQRGRITLTNVARLQSLLSPSAGVGSRAVAA
jgi:CRP/FNR family transcriptional regulator